MKWFSSLTRALVAVSSEARFAPALVGSLSVQTHGVVAALVCAGYTLVIVWDVKNNCCYFRFRVITNEYFTLKRVYLTYAVVFAINVLQIEAVLALAEVAAECVHTLPVVRTQVLSSYTLIDV